MGWPLLDPGFIASFGIIETITVMFVTITIYNSYFAGQNQIVWAINLNSSLFGSLIFLRIWTYEVMAEISYLFITDE